jgi:hypothetical protein
MKIKIVIGLIIIVFFNSCERLNLKEDVPDCIKDKVKEFSKSDKICEQGASVYRYIFQGEYVYLFEPGNCRSEPIAQVFDEKCNFLCDLGGFMGNLICKDVLFFENVKDKTLIWEN